MSGGVSVDLLSQAFSDDQRLWISINSSPCSWTGEVPEVLHEKIGVCSSQCSFACCMMRMEEANSLIAVVGENQAGFRGWNSSHASFT